MIRTYEGEMLGRKGTIVEIPCDIDPIDEAHGSYAISVEIPDDEQDRLCQVNKSDLRINGGNEGWVKTLHMGEDESLGSAEVVVVLPGNALNGSNWLYLPKTWYDEKLEE